MTLSFPAPALTPTADDCTCNSASSGSFMGAYDFLCFPGMIISCLADQTLTCSTGSQLAVETLYIEEHVRREDIAILSVGSADSSVLGNREDRGESGGYATQFRFPSQEYVSLDLDALMLLLGELVSLVLKTAAQDPSESLSPDLPQAG